MKLTVKLTLFLLVIIAIVLGVDAVVRFRQELGPSVGLCQGLDVSHVKLTGRSCAREEHYRDCDETTRRDIHGAERYSTLANRFKSRLHRAP